MTRSSTRRTANLADLEFEYRKHEEPELGATIHTLIARHPHCDPKGWGGRGANKDWHNRAGHISWYETHDFCDPMNGEIGGVEVHPDYRRQGIATALHNRAREICPNLQHSEDLTDDGRAWSRAVGSRRLAYGETKAPADVDTLRDPNCPVCGDDCFDGAECSVCGFVQPPAFLRDPDLNKAQQMDLRKQVAEEDPNANQQEPLQPNDVASPDDINDDGTYTGDKPGSLPGEVEGEVQTAQDGLDENGVPQEGDVPTGPDGEPVGPQDLPAEAQDPMGKPFTQGPDMPDGPGEPDAPEGNQGMEPGFADQTGAPQAAENVQDTELTCDNCGFQAESSQPDSIDLENPEQGNDGTVAGDVCPYCQQGQLMSGAELKGGDSAPPVAI